MTSTTGRPKLPVWPTIGEAFASVLTNWQAVLRIFWAWLAILTGICALAFQMIWVADLMIPPPEFFLLLSLLWVLGFIAFAAAAVAWHRLLLLGEQPPPIRVGAPVLRYLGRILLIGLTAIPIQLFCALLFFFFFYFLPLRTVLPSPSFPPSAGYLVAFYLEGLVVILPTILVVSRISISLPAIAVERPMGLDDAWELTEGNSFRLCGGTLLIYMPVFVVVSAIQLSAHLQPSRTLAMLAFFGASFFSTVASISFLSLGYRFFARPHQLPSCNPRCRFG